MLLFHIAGTVFKISLTLSAKKEDFLFSDLELWPITLNYEINIDRVNHHAKYLD